MLTNQKPQQRRECKLCTLCNIKPETFWKRLRLYKSNHNVELEDQRAPLRLSYDNNPGVTGFKVQSFNLQRQTRTVHAAEQCAALSTGLTAVRSSECYTS
jgi:hypothetical protein